MLDVSKMTLEQYVETFMKGGSMYQPAASKSKSIAFSYKLPDGKKVRKTLVVKDEADAEKKKREFLTNVYLGFSQPVVVKSVIPSVIPQKEEKCMVTVRDAVSSYLPTYKPTVTKSTYEAKKGDLNRICKVIGNQIVCDLDADQIQDMVNQISIKKDGTLSAPKTVKTTIISLKSLLKYCRKKKWISREDLELLTDDIKIPTAIKDSTHEQEVKASKFLEYDELGDILCLLMDNPYYFYLIRIAVLTGMRPQELLGLKKSDLYRDKHYIEVSTAVKRTEKHGDYDRSVEIGVPKNKYSRRKVPATDEVFGYFDKLENAVIASGGRRNSVRTRNEGLVVVDRNGNVPDVHSLGTNLVRYMERRGAEKFITLGMPRHCYQDYLDGLDAREDDVEKAVGHVLMGMGNKAYKNNENYLIRLLPLVEELGKNIENAYQSSLKKMELRA